MRLLYLSLILSSLRIVFVYASSRENLTIKRREEQPSEGQKVSDNIPEIELPPSLTLEEFDKLTSTKLSLIEFYSPYCHHCKSFYPTWEKSYRILKSKYPMLNIDMRQVNCVENGDLCEREVIEFYPNMVLYSPVFDQDGKPTGKSKNIDTFPRTLQKNVDNIIKYLQESVAEYDEGSALPSVSKQMNVDEILRAIGGEIEKPMFVSFWQANQEQWDSVDNGGKLKFSENCADCMRTKNVWDKLSNKVVSISDTGHLMCKDFPKICEKLELHSFKDGKRSPVKYIMFLPKTVGAIRFDYNGEVDVEKMKKWVNKLYVNAAYEVVSARGVTEIMEYTKTLPHEPIPQTYPLKNKVTVLFFYDVDTLTPEDEAILPHMLRTLQDSPFNIQLYKGKHKKILENIQTMGENLINYINYDENEKYEYDKAMEIATTITTLPSIFIFKENSLIPVVYQSFAVEQMRIYEKIEEFIKRNQHPFNGELTPELVPAYFLTKNEDINEMKDSKIVIILLDLSKKDQADQELYKLSLINHEYNFLKKKHYFDQIKKAREIKQEEVEKLQAENAESSKILKTMRKEVPHLFNNDDVIFTFIDKSDKSQSKNFKYVKNWNINLNNYEVGDALVVSRDNRYIWDENLQGMKLKNDPKQLKSVLMSLLLKDGRLPRGLVGSPFGGSLNFMNYIHDFGIWGYGLIFIIIYLIATVSIKFLRKKKYRSQGIIAINNGAFLPKKD
ncbi:uncharacterized protein KGF55_001558 [Candida pseudojiufengensis]|uniref:uncharacterized protein n=1 Tax=Candida pseudojiufengensis TaxID=497109 RepID=UPI0022240E57|nr:uncharacterized protein KGF55_001558 [Candida pseudojiufengensis]KAI5965337.1 hypothetical protein KGF55_001558 [Candida pseudojiufengensis]